MTAANLAGVLGHSLLRRDDRDALTGGERTVTANVSIVVRDLIQHADVVFADPSEDGPDP